MYGVCYAATAIPWIVLFARYSKNETNPDPPACYVSPTSKQAFATPQGHWLEREEKAYAQSWYVWGYFSYSLLIIMPLWYSFLVCYCWKKKALKYWPFFQLILTYVLLFRYVVYLWALAVRLSPSGRICAGREVEACIEETGDDVNCNPENVFQISGGRLLLAYILIHIVKIVWVVPMHTAFESLEI